MSHARQHARSLSRPVLWIGMLLLAATATAGSAARAADGPLSKVHVTGLHRKSDWPRDQYPADILYDGSEPEVFPGDRACIQLQLKELEAALKLSRTDALARVETLESVHIDLQYANLPRNKLSARVSESYWAKIPIPLGEGATYKVRLKSKLHLSPIMPNTRKDNDPMRCLPVGAETIRAALQAPEMDFPDMAQFIEAERAVRNDPVTGTYLQSISGAFGELERKCGINRYSKALLTENQKRCLESRALLKEGSSRGPMPDAAIQGERRSKNLPEGGSGSADPAGDAAARKAAAAGR